MKIRHLSGVILIVLLILMASEGKSEHFTFQVPVSLTNLHQEIEKGRITCYVTDSQNKILPAASPWQNSVDVNITGGNYQGAVTVKLNVDNPWLAATYSCAVYLKSKYEGSFRSPSTFKTGDTAIASQKESTQGALPKQ